MNAPLRRTPSVADTYGHTLTLEQVLEVLHISRTTAKRQMQAGTFPIPPLPRHPKRAPYRFAAVRVDRFLARAMEEA